MSIEQKIEELLAESKKLKSGIPTEIEQVEELTEAEMGSIPNNASKVKGSSAGSDPSFLAAAASAGGYKPEEEENNARNNTKSQNAACNATSKSANVANANATAPEASHLANMKEESDVEEEYHLDISKDMDALTNGEDLSEEFKAKAAVIFEAAIVSRVKREVAKLEEKFEAALEEAAEENQKGLIEKVDGYLGYIAEQWIAENELALESGIKTEITESFIDGMKNLFAEHYIDVPEEKFDVLADLQEQLEDAKAKLNEQFESNVELSKLVNEQKRSSSIEQIVIGLADTEAEKFKALAEELTYEDSDTFTSKLKVIRENYFGGKKVSTVNSVVTDTPIETLTESANIDPSVRKYMTALNSIK